MMPEEPFVLSFSEIRATDIPLVGGKGANLGELTHAGFPVPSGFCLTVAAFQQFVHSSADASDLYALLATVTTEDLDTVRTVGQQVRETLLDVPVPPNIGQAVLQQWKRLGPRHAYAVRSSATAEDLPDASFAGQQDTYLNVFGETDLLDAVRKCWVSLFTDRAIIYRCQNGFSHQDVQLSVVVQQMVMAEFSGVLFTADPLTGHRHTLSIDASFGLGEALVGGLVSPDSYRVDKRKRAILDRQIADKLVAIFPQKDGGTHKETLSDAQRAQPVLTDDQVLSLADLGGRVEAHYGSPQDIEWAIAEEQIYLLQARPITALYPIEGLSSPDDSLHIYFSAGHQQMMTNAMSPLSMSIMKCVIPGRRAQNQLESAHVYSSGGRLFMDITPALRHPILRKIVFGALAQFDALAPEGLQIAMERPEFQRPHGLSLSFPMFRGILHLVYRILSNVWWRDLTGTVRAVDNMVAQRVQDVKTELNGLPAGEAQIRAIIQRMNSLLFVVLNWAPQFIAAEIARRLMVRIGRRWADPADLEAFNLGLPGNVVTDMNLAVGDLAGVARRSPQLVVFFDQLGDNSQAWLAQAAQTEGSDPFFQAWEAFILRYGARGPSEIDIKMPRWYEEPLPLLQVIANYLQKEPGSHRAQHQMLAQARQKAVSRLLSGAHHGFWGWLRKRLVRRLIHVVHHGGVLREHHKFMMVQILRTVKEVVKKTAVQLTDTQKLSHPDDIWFLSLPELVTIWAEDAFDAAALIPARRADLARFQKMTPPLIITSDGESPVVNYHVADAPPGALVGNPVSAGVVEGTARVIRDPQKETLLPGEILVAPFTDPGWTPLFINAGGLIMEVGGMMTHGSVVAREYGIPAVVGVRAATQTLQTGQQVRIDGNRGVIEIL